MESGPGPPWGYDDISTKQVTGSNHPINYDQHKLLGTYSNPKSNSPAN